MNQLTTEQLMKATGVRSRQTIDAWRKARLLGEPQLRPSPTGRGRALFWDKQAVADCLRVKELQREGMTLDEIRKELKRQRTGKKKKRPRRRNSIFRTDGEAVAVAEQITREVKRVARFVREIPTKDLLTRDHLQKAIKMEEGGQSSVLLIRQAKIFVTTVEDAKSFLSDSDEAVAMTVIPLKGLLKALSKPKDKIEKQPRLEYEGGREYGSIDLDE